MWTKSACAEYLIFVCSEIYEPSSGGPYLGGGGAAKALGGNFNLGGGQKLKQSNIKILNEQTQKKGHHNFCF